MVSPTPPDQKDPASGALLLAALGFCTGGLAAFVGLVIGLRALVLAIRRPGSLRRKVTAIVAIGANLCILGVAAIALQSLLRVKVTARESTVLDDIRTMISAQAAYSQHNDGRYEPRLECLGEPATCLPDDAKDRRPFLEPSLASLQAKAGYRRAFHPGPLGTYDGHGPALVLNRDPLRLEPRPPAAAGPAREHAWVAVPVAAGQTGVRSFCFDSSGMICFRPDGADIPTVAGQCPVESGGSTPLPWRARHGGGVLG